MPTTAVSTQRATQRGGGMLQILPRYVLAWKATRGNEYIDYLKFTTFPRQNDKTSNVSYLR